MRKRATSCGNEECRYKYNTYNFNKKLSTPPQSQSLSLQLRCVFHFVLRLSFVSLRCVCVVSALCLRVTCVWCRYIRVSSLFFHVLVLFQSKSLQGSFPRPYNSLKVNL